MDIKIVNKSREINCTVLWNPKSTKVLIIGSAIGVSRNFYRDIANYYFDLSYSVICFDYYAMVNHKQAPKHCKQKISDWGRKDMNSVIDFAKRKFPEDDLYFLGHSIAGQLFPLAEKSCEIKAAYLIASQNVSNKNWTGVFKLKVVMFWYFLIPLFTSLFGYLPSFVYGGKYNLHKSIARDWAKLGKNKSGILGAEKDASRKYKDLNLPVKFLSFSDDQMLAPQKSVKHLYESYGSPYKYHEHINPKEIGLDSIGHFNFFKPRYALLWPKIDSWFNIIDAQV
ncbi:hypothetical protein [Winogradskyella sp. 3972H.M.0a.05]|uniref:alpha/beta hydrolase family protein n=1 Tax=Winogradskyella sp. 3972H.M.0a.05 TaxID=2950277 RepID=UPI003393C065